MIKYASLLLLLWSIPMIPEPSAVCSDLRRRQSDHPLSNAERHICNFWTYSSCRFLNTPKVQHIRPVCVCVSVRACVKACPCITVTSVHDSPGVHVFECTAELDKVLPHRSLWDEPPLLLKVLQNQAATTTHTHRNRTEKRKVVLPMKEKLYQ